MKIISQYFESIAGVEIYPVISFLIFFFFFIVVTVMVARMKKQEIRELSAIPLDDNEEAESLSEASH